MSKNDIDNHIFRMLILSDLHYESKRKEDFEKIFNPFLKTLSSFLHTNREWTPQCLALVGDIAHCENDATGYDDIHSFIEKMQIEIGTSFQVVTVPGNHDKQLTVPTLTKEEEEKIKDASEQKKAEIKEKAKLRASQHDLKEAETFLKTYTSTNPADCQKISEYLKKYFGYYAHFTSPYYNTSNWHPIPYLNIEKKLLNISGYYLVEHAKVCLIALNTEWKYVIGNAGNHRTILTLDSKVIEQIEKNAINLKRKGYSIITLMHRSPYRLCWADIYGSLDENSLVERLIGMSDLIICGHEHNTKNREPDMLMNSTLLYQNGSMFDRKKEDCRYPYSASLIRYDTKAHMLNVIRIRFNTGNALTYEWTASSDDVKTYCMEPMTSSKPRHLTLSNELYKEVSFSYPIEQEILHKKIRSLFYNGSTPNDIPSYIDCSIMPLNVDTIMKQVNQKIQNIKQENIENEPFFKLYVLLLYSERSENKDFDDQTQNAISLYKEVKSLIRKEEIGHKMVTNLIFCNILI